MTSIKIMTKEKGLEYLVTLQSFYSSLMSEQATEEERFKILEETDFLVKYTKQKIQERKDEKGVDSRQTFNLEFVELVSQIAIIIRRLNLKVLKFNSRKLYIMMSEFESMLGYRKKETFADKIKALRSKEILRLMGITFKQVGLTFGIAVVVNIILTKMGVLAVFEDQILALVSLEAGMAALIVFITSFNLSYTNGKRGSTDMALINFTNKLNLYARRIKFVLQQEEDDKSKRKEIFEDVNYYFNCIGLKIIEGVNPEDAHNLKFDITILQCFDHINDLIGGYVSGMEEVSKIRTREIQDAMIEAMNDFQIIATVRTPVVFSSLNDWLIKVTYFCLAAISPLAVLPRLFILNVFQRAFFNVAREVDNAIYSNSIAKLPVESRIVRRLCRISSILNED